MSIKNKEPFSYHHCIHEFWKYYVVYDVGGKRYLVILIGIRMKYRNLRECFCRKESCFKGEKQLNVKKNNNNRKAMSVVRFVLAMALGVLCQLFAVRVTEAGEQLYFDEWGNLRMTTYDRIATSSRTYKTIGWTIKRYDMPIGAGNDCVIVILEDDGLPQVDPNNPAYQNCYFWCDKQTIFDKIGEVSKQWQQELYSNGGNVYLDAVMTVCVQGVPQGGLLNDGEASWGRVFNTFVGIAGAENWADPGALSSHYDKQVHFPGNPAMLEPHCNYQVKFYECFDDRSEVWSMSRYLKDMSGKMKLNDQVTVTPGMFEGYYYEFDSARIRTRDVNGTDRETWTHNEAVNISFTDDKLVAITVDMFYKRVEQTSYRTDKYNIYEDKVLMEAEIAIGAGTAANKTFDVKEGVPTGEELYVDGSVNAFGYMVKYKKHYGIRTVPVSIMTEYECQWMEAGGAVRKQIITDTETYYVDRPYGYWEIDEIDVRTLDSVTILNYAFAQEQVQLTNLYEPEIVIEQKDEHMQIDGATTYRTSGGVIYAQPGVVELPKGYRQTDANRLLGNYKVCNDTFSIDGEVFLSGNDVTSYGGDPKLGSMGKRISFYEEQLVIPHTKVNGYGYDSSAVVCYRKYDTGECKEQDFWEVNPVSIHTPVVCHGFITDEKQYNQLCQPDENTKTWILGRNFEVAISAYGQHKEQLGYGIQDYDKYVKAYEVQFPFEVYYGNQYCGANRWITLVEGQQFYLPTGVKEGEYTITVRTLAQNYTDGASAGKIYNEYFSDHAAYEHINVIVAGRLYGLKITDISSKDWSGVFYDENGQYTGNGYYVGQKNEDGVFIRKNPLTAFPILQGGNPYLPQNEGEPLGTSVSFEMETIGDYESTDGIYIEPIFYVIDPKTGQQRQKVDVYHFYEKDGKEVWENVMKHGESGPQYLRQEARVNIGDETRNVMDTAVAQSSVQRWSSKFMLPEDIYVVPSGFDVEAYIAQNGLLDASDEAFIKNGYLMVQFQIYSMKNEQSYLAYINKENAKKGFANMWQIEGFVNPRPQADLSMFYLEMGDVFIYDLAKGGEADHKIVGTH